MVSSLPVVQIYSRIVDWLGTAPGRVTLAIVVLVTGWYLSKVVVRFIGRPVAQRFQRPSMTRTVLRGIRFSTIFLAFLVAALILGFEPENIIISVTIFSAVVGVILAPIAGSIINGLFVLADQPYEIGDLIELVDVEKRGYVEDITLRYTKIFTVDNALLVIPNSAMRERDVLNYSAEDERTRLSLDVDVTYEGDLDQARDLIVRAAREVDDVIKGGPSIRVGSARYHAGPRCQIVAFGDHGVHLRLRYWVRNPYHLQRVRSEVHERVWSALQEAEIDVEIPYPHSHIVFDDTSGQASVSVDDGRLEIDPHD